MAAPMQDGLSRDEHSRHDLAWDVEEACLNARPSPREIVLQGWLLRAAGGPTRRTNSLNPLRGGRGDPHAVITQAERIYAGLGRPVIVRVPTLAAEMPAALDPAIYRTEGETCTLFADGASLAAEMPKDVTLQPEADAAWFAAWGSCDGVESDLAGTTYRESVERILLPRMFVTEWEGTVPVAVAYGVLHRGLLVLESVATRVDHRRRGHGARVVEALLAWGRGQGVRGACLQVTAGNLPALALYRRLGFAHELYRYRYWRRD